MLNRKIAVALSGLALVGGAVGVVAVSGASESASSLSEAGVPAGDSIPQGLSKALDSGVATEFGLDASTVRRVQLTSADESVWIAPGSKGGLCIANATSYSCTPDASAGLTLTRLPAPPKEYGQAMIAAQEAGLTGAAAEESVRRATADAPAWHGSAQYVGYAPAGVTSASLVASDGTVIASAEPHDSIFEFTVADIATVSPSSVRLDGGSNTEPLTLPDLDSMFGSR